MARVMKKAATACLALMLATGGNTRGFVDRHRVLQDVNMEEEVGQLGHEQTVIAAEEKDSTTAKATSSVHVPHKDSSTADIQGTKID